MEDLEIIELYNLRSEQAIAETGKKYGAVCGKIAGAILNDAGDAEECVNTAYYKLWNTIPPKQPESLCGYLFAVVRNTAISAYQKIKRRTGSYVYQELDEIIPDKLTVEARVDSRQLGEMINGFLSGENLRTRQLFTARYYFNMSMADIGESLGMSESAVKTRLLRIRRKLKTYLEERGVAV